MFSSLDQYWDDECNVQCLQETNHWVLAPQVCKLDQFKTHPSCSRPAQRPGPDHVQIPASHWSMSAHADSDWPRICNLSSSSHSGCSYQQGFLKTFFSSLIILVFPSSLGSYELSFIVRSLPRYPSWSETPILSGLNKCNKSKSPLYLM